jgi:hypothetical protein
VPALAATAPSPSPYVPLPPTTQASRLGELRFDSFKLPAIAGLVAAVIAGVIAFSLMGGGASAPTEAQIDHAFTPLTEATYQEMPPAAMQQLEAMIDAIPAADAAISSFDARQVLQGGRTLGAALIFGFDPDAFDPADKEAFYAGFKAASGGVELEEIQLGGVEAYRASGPQGSGVLFFDETDGMMFEVVTQSPDLSMSIAQQLARANL